MIIFVQITMAAIRYRLPKDRESYDVHGLAQKLTDPELKLQPIAKGSQGKIYLVRNANDRSDQYAVKLVCSAVFACERMDSDAHTELAALLYFREQYVRTGLTPHLPDLVDCVHQEDLVMTITKYASHGNLYRWVGEKGRLLGERVWRAILFQLTIALAWVERLDPGFRHNDLYSKNVLVYTDLCEGHTRYTSPDGADFYVPNVGYRVVISDFDMAVLSGKFESLHSMAMQVDNFSRGCGYEGLVAYDLYRIFRDLFTLAREARCLHLLTTTILTCSTFWDEDMSRAYEFEEPPHIRPSKCFTLYPACSRVLHDSGLFREYQTLQGCASRGFGDRLYAVLQASELRSLFGDINLGDPRTIGLPEFMFGATGREIEYYQDLPSRAIFHQIFLTDSEESGNSTDTEDLDYTGKALEGWLERLLYNYDCGDRGPKLLRVDALMKAALVHLKPRGIQNLSLLQICFYFFEAPLPKCARRMGEFSRACLELHIRIADAVLLQYSWMKKRMLQLGEWPQ